MYGLQNEISTNSPPQRRSSAPPSFLDKRACIIIRDPELWAALQKFTKESGAVTNAGMKHAVQEFIATRFQEEGKNLAAIKNSKQAIESLRYSSPSILGLAPSSANDGGPASTSRRIVDMLNLSKEELQDLEDEYETTEIYEKNSKEMTDDIIDRYASLSRFCGEPLDYTRLPHHKGALIPQTSLVEQCQ